MFYETWNTLDADPMGQWADLDHYLLDAEEEGSPIDLGPHDPDDQIEILAPIAAAIERVLKEGTNPSVEHFLLARKIELELEVTELQL